MKKTILSILILSFFLITSCGPKTVNKIDNNIGERVKPIDFTLKSLSGREVKLSELKGKVVVINFFTTRCPYCKDEMPDFIKVSKEYKDVEFLFVAAGEDAENLKKYIQSTKFDIDPLLDTTGKVSTDYKLVGVPTTFFVDREGNLIAFTDSKGNKVNMNIGPMNQKQLKSVIDSAIK